MPDPTDYLRRGIQARRDAFRRGAAELADSAAYGRGPVEILPGTGTPPSARSA